MTATSFKDFKDRPVVIMGYPKSGTTLLLSLLDYHPQLVVFPFELKYFQRIIGPGYYRDISKQEKIDILFNKVGLNRFKNNKIDYREGVAYGNHDFSDIDYSVFKDRVLDRINRAQSDKEIMLSVIESYYDVEQSDKRDKRAWVEKTPYNNYYFPLMKKWFGDDMICLHVIRDPYDNFASYRKKLFPTLTIKRFCSDWIFSKSLIPLAKKIIKDYHVIKYEDLVNEPENVMKKVCEWINIDFDEYLLQPSLNGKPWFGNSAHGHKFQSISNKSVGVAAELLKDHERKEIEHILDGKSRRFSLHISKRRLAFYLRYYFEWLYKPLIRLVKRIKP